MTSVGWTVTSLAAILFILISVKHLTSADPVSGIVHCMNNEDCKGAHRICFHNKSSNEGTCTCERGYEDKEKGSIVCVKELEHECNTDADCSSEEVCMTWSVPLHGFSRTLYEPMDNTYRNSKRQRLCMGAWLFNNEFLDGPRTGGGLKHRFYADDFFFRRRPRAHQQYIGFVEDMMLILFLICILVTLIAVHRASCYRQFREARRNTPLRYILPIAADRPPPYSDQRQDVVDGLTGVVVGDSQGLSDKSRSETPPPSYDEALTRVNLPPESDLDLASEASHRPLVTIDTNTDTTNATDQAMASPDLTPYTDLPGLDLQPPLSSIPGPNTPPLASTSTYQTPPTSPENEVNSQREANGDLCISPYTVDGLNEIDEHTPQDSPILSHERQSKVVSPLGDSQIPPTDLFNIPTLIPRPTSDKKHSQEDHGDGVIKGDSLEDGHVSDDEVFT